MTTPLYVHEFGRAAGTPVLALHDVTGHGGQWRSFAETELVRCRVLAPDLPGHGRSSWLPPWTLERCAADLLGLLDRSGLDSVVALGFSFGGAVALQLARLAPGRVNKLVLIEPATGLRPEVALEGANQRQHLFMEPRQAWRAQRAQWPLVTDEAIDAEIAAHLEQVGSPWRFRYSAPAAAAAWSEMARTAVLPPSGTPTLLVRARHDSFVSAAFVNGCQLTLQDDFEIVDIDGGRLVHLDHPVEVGTAVTRFIFRDAPARHARG